MNFLTPRSSSLLKECTALVCLGLVLVVVMPLLGILALLFRSAIVTAAGLVLAAIAGVWAWHLVSPTRKPFRPAPKH